MQRITHKALERLLLALALAATLAGCGPEDGRARGAGLGTGADVDNRAADFKPASKVFNAPVQEGQSQP